MIQRIKDWLQNKNTQFTVRLKQDNRIAVVNRITDKAKFFEGGNIDYVYKETDIKFSVTKFHSDLICLDYEVIDTTHFLHHKILKSGTCEINDIVTENTTIGEAILPSRVLGIKNENNKTS